MLDLNDILGGEPLQYPFVVQEVSVISVIRTKYMTALVICIARQTVATSYTAN